MKPSSSIKSITDDRLLAQLSQLVSRSRRVESDLVAHIGEVDQRRLYAREAAPSMFAYCVDVLHLSEAEAYLRIAAARAARHHPVLLEMLADGRLHLSGIAKLAPHLTESNRDAVLARAAHKSKREIEVLIAELSPKPDVPTSIRKLPQPRTAPSPAQLRPDAVPKSPAPAPAPKPEPLAPARYKIQFTASAALRDKLERLALLMQTSVPDGDLGAILEQAVTEKIERLEAKRYGKTKSPRKSVETPATTKPSRYIPAAVRRVVHQRDVGKCTYVSADGRQCTERKHLEFHHVAPYARGGAHEPSNVRLMCRQHNAYLATLDFGEDFMDRRRHKADRARETSPVYGNLESIRADMANSVRTELRKYTRMAYVEPLTNLGENSLRV